MASFCEESSCLGLGPEWLEYCQQNEQTGIENDRRFANFVTDEELADFSKGFVPKNTTSSTSWAIRNYKAWEEARNTSYPSKKVPPNLLRTTDKALLNEWLSRYVVETRNKSGAHYPPSTLYQLLGEILRHMRTENTSCPNFLDKRDSAFKQLHGTLDSHFRKLHEAGIGRKVKHAELITKDEENKLWSFGEMGSCTPTALQNAVFFCNGKNFCLRGGEVHRNRKLSQFERLR